MPYRMKTEGLKELIDEIKALGDSAWYIGSFALYEGAAVMADAIDTEAKTIKITKSRTDLVYRVEGSPSRPS